MRDALNATGRPIYFSMCEWGVDQPAKWGRQVGTARWTRTIRSHKPSVPTTSWTFRPLPELCLTFPDL
eukprot:980145-Pyramimonas_sp.AAC.1